MLTPDKIEELENNNKIVDMYRKLNIDICKNIIHRLINVNDKDKIGTGFTIDQLRTLKETGGDKIFEETLLKTNKLSKECKEELKKLYKRVSNETRKHYTDLYKYKNESMATTPTQIKILNGAINQSNKELNNFTKTIAFSSKQLYVDAVDQAYFDVISGGISYNDAIKKAVKMVADKGITLKDSIGRNVKLKTAIKRNILTGIKQTADNINKDIDDMLGCDGYETTAHAGARPSHALWQGKQFAKTQELADKYNVPLWDKSLAKEELNDYNCRHTYFGIILGISEPVYSKQEIKQMNNQSNELKIKQNNVKNEIEKAKDKEKMIINISNDITKEIKEQISLKISELLQKNIVLKREIKKSEQ